MKATSARLIAAEREAATRPCQECLELAGRSDDEMMRELEERYIQFRAERDRTMTRGDLIQSAEWHSAEAERLRILVAERRW